MESAETPRDLVLRNKADDEEGEKEEEKEGEKEEEKKKEKERDEEDEEGRMDAKKERKAERGKVRLKSADLITKSTIQNPNYSYYEMSKEKFAQNEILL